jgi:hypothetical protein
MRDNGTNSIDEIAARINADAARVAGLLDERIRQVASTRGLSSPSMRAFMGHGEPTEEERERDREQQQGCERDEERARAMAGHVEAIRSAAAELQRLEAEVRAKPSLWASA